MILSSDITHKILITAYNYLDHPYDYKTFDCVHFIVRVYLDVGIVIPRFGGTGFPPSDLHISYDEFEGMPVGQTVFFRRKASTSSRIWTHMAIIAPPHELIHCSRHFGGKVTITPKTDFMEIYAHVHK